MKRSTTWLVAAAFSVLLTALAFSYLHHGRAMEQARRAADEAEAVRDLAEQVKAVNNRPAVVLTTRDQVRQLSGLVESTATRCGIDPKRITDMNAEAPRQVGQTPYFRLPTRIEINQVELPQLMDLLAALTEGESLTIESCRITAPHTEVVGKTWNAEFTLAYLLYDPEHDRSTR